MTTMTFHNPTVPGEVMDAAMEIVYNVSDEVGEEDLLVEGGPYYVRYEGWSSVCVTEAVERTEAVLRRRKISPESAEGRDMIEADCREYAAEQSDAVIRNWGGETDNRMVASGHEDSGLYGVTWAIFRRV